jgi:hypothetical protein
LTVDMVWDDPGPAPIRHSPTKDGGSRLAAARQSCGSVAMAAMRRLGDLVAAAARQALVAALVEKMHPLALHFSLWIL